MSGRPRSAVLITIDSLRFDRLGLAGGTQGCSPTIDALARTGQWHTRAYANSWYTQFSFPSILSSTLPLDCGGYDRGIRDRPLTLAEACRSQGLRTAAFSSDPYLNEFYGYERGFDNFFELFDVAGLWQHVCRDYVAHYAERLAQGTLNSDEFQALVQPLVARLLTYGAEYFARKQRAPELKLRALQSPLYHQDFAALESRARAEHGALGRDPATYIAALLQTPDVLAGNSLSSAHDEGESSHGLLARVADALGAYSRKHEHRMVDAREIAGLAETWIGAERDKPFFAWLSLADVHDGNFCHRWMSRETWRYRRQARRTSDEARLRADMSLQYVDDAIGRLTSALHRMGVLDSTLIVVCSDHGRIDGAAPFAGTFSDALMRVPLLFWHSGMSARVAAHPCSLLDVAPTILDLLGLDAQPSFRGVALASPAATARPQIIAEQLGSGPCDLVQKQPAICLVGRTYKYAWDPSGREWYNDLAQRPRRGFVVPRDASERARVAPLRAAAERRYAEILQGTDAVDRTDR